MSENIKTSLKIDSEKWLNALIAIIQSINSFSAPKQSLREILHILDSCLELIQGLITLNGWNGHPLTVRITDIEAEPSQVQESLSARSAAAVKQALETAGPIIDLHLDQTINQQSPTASPILLCVPILLHEKPSGALAVILFLAEEKSQQETIRFLNTVAVIVSLLLRSCKAAPMRKQFDADVTGNYPDLSKLPVQVTRIEEEMILEALKQSGGRIRQACQQLGITQRMMRYKLKKLGIDHKQYFIPKANRLQQAD